MVNDQRGKELEERKRRQKNAKDRLSTDPNSDNIETSDTSQRGDDEPFDYYDNLFSDE